jgi:hypothetical protein
MNHPPIPQRITTIPKNTSTVMVDEGLSVGVAIFVYQLDSSLSAGPYSSTYILGFPFNTACPCAITQELCARIIAPTTQFSPTA